MKVALFGLGYVGSVTAICLARMGHKVIAVDKDLFKVKSLQDGVSPIVETGVQPALDEVMTTGLVEATENAAVALQDADLSIVCVGTPSDRRTGKVSVSSVQAVIGEIVQHLPDDTRQHPVVIRSTVLPSSLIDGANPEWVAQYRNSPKIEIVHHPEFLREGSALKDFFNPPMIIVGCETEAVAEKVFSLYNGIESKRFHVNPETASMLKYASNVFHALKIGFANEFARLSDNMGIDANELMKLFVEDVQLNISKAYLRPGMSFGGSCLPKDLRALVAIGREKHIDTPILDAIYPSNTTHTGYVLDKILDLDARRLLLFGLTFKVGTDDLRESPSVELAERLIGKGYEIRIWEPDLDDERFVGQNREYALAHLPHLQSIMITDPADCIEWAEAVVATKNHPLFKPFIERINGKMPVLNAAEFRW